MKESLRDFLFNLVISMFIGLFASMAEITVVNINDKVIFSLIMSSILGGFIGTISRFVFIYILAIKQMDVKLGFISVFIIIGVISCIPSFYCYLIVNEKISVITLMSILATAELLGMSFCYYSYKNYLEFNSKLVNKKKQFREND